MKKYQSALYKRNKYIIADILGQSSTTYFELATVLEKTGLSEGMTGPNLEITIKFLQNFRSLLKQMVMQPSQYTSARNFLRETGNPELTTDGYYGMPHLKMLLGLDDSLLRVGSEYTGRYTVTVLSKDGALVLKPIKDGRGRTKKTLVKGATAKELRLIDNLVKEIGIMQETYNG